MTEGKSDTACEVRELIETSNMLQIVNSEYEKITIKSIQVKKKDLKQPLVQ